MPLFAPLQVWLGYNQSLRALEMGLTLNVDVASTAFIQEQVLNPVPLFCMCHGN